MSPRRYAGWEPATVYHYDDAGRISHTTTEPEWDTLDQALIDELLNWQAGVHRCGHHESEFTDDAVFQGVYTVCPACAAMQAAQEAQAKKDQAELKAGRNPDYSRWWRSLRRSRAQMAQEAAQQADRKSPQQRMNEAVARLERGGS